MPTKSGVDGSGGGRMMPAQPSGKKSGKKAAAPIASIGTPKPRPSWQSFEDSKLRVGQAMDKVEFLGRSRDLYTALASQQATNFELTLRHRQAASSVSRTNLSKSVGDLQTVIASKSAGMIEAKTPAKRLEALNKYFIQQETALNGEECGNAAKKSCKKLKPLTADYPAYSNLVTTKLSTRGVPREAPLMSVTCGFPYRPPMDALFHGAPKTLPLHLSSPLNKSMLSASSPHLRSFNGSFGASMDEGED